MASTSDFSIAQTPEEVAAAAAATIEDYTAVAEGYAAGNMGHDVSQNLNAMLAPLRDRAPPLDVLDVCCGSGRDLVALQSLGHAPVGLDGVKAFCDMSRALAGVEVWEQSLTALDLPAARFDAVFCNACLCHVPRAALPETLRHLAGALRPGGVLFVCSAHGFGADLRRL